MSSQVPNEDIYELPAITFRDDGWGPSSIPEQFSGVPFNSFSRDENMGMIIDISNIQNLSRRGLAGGDGDDGMFSTVDISRSYSSKKQKLIRTKMAKNFNANSSNYNSAASGKTRTLQKKNNANYQRKNYDLFHISSLPIKTSWKYVYQVDFSDLAKLSTKELPTITDFAECGGYCTYDSRFDRIVVKKPTLLEPHPECGSKHVVSVMKDPFISQIIGNNQASVYTTAEAISHIMMATRSNLSWDLEIIKNDKGIFISHRDNILDLLTVNETSLDGITEEDYKDNSLREEATDINRDFLRQVMTDEVTDCKFPSPFAGDVKEGEKPVPCMFRYRKFNLPNGKVMLVRTEVDGCQVRGNTKQMLNVFALNEWSDSTPMDNRWRRKLESSSGFAIAEEMKNNFFRISRWAVESMIAGVDVVKIGLVSRKIMKEKKGDHMILGVQSFSMDGFSKQLMINEKNMWAVVEEIINVMDKQENGFYIMMKDPIKGMVRIYEVPEEDVTKIEEATEDEDEYSESEYSGSEYSESGSSDSEGSYDEE